MHAWVWQFISSTHQLIFDMAMALAQLLCGELTRSYKTIDQWHKNHPRKLTIQQLSLQVLLLPLRYLLKALRNLMLLLWLLLLQLLLLQLLLRDATMEARLPLTSWTHEMGLRVLWHVLLRRVLHTTRLRLTDT